MCSSRSERTPTIWVWRKGRRSSRLGFGLGSRFGQRMSYESKKLSIYPSLPASFVMIPLFFAFVLLDFSGPRPQYHTYTALTSFFFLLITHSHRAVATGHWSSDQPLTCTTAPTTPSTTTTPEGKAHARELLESNDVWRWSKSLLIFLS
jgi:hypothetical protein